MIRDLILMIGFVTSLCFYFSFLSVESWGLSMSVLDSLRGKITASKLMIRDLI